MKQNDINSSAEEANVNSNCSQPKPLKKLVKVDRNNNQNINISQNDNSGYHGRYEAEPNQEVQYKGRYEAEPNQEVQYKGRYEADETPHENQEMYISDDEYCDDASPQGETAVKRFSVKDILIKILVVLVSIVLIFVLILNMPIIAYSKTGQPVENVSIITFLKRWQPLLPENGTLQENSMVLDLNSDIVHEEFNDGLDLPQTIEGQYTVLFLGFDVDSNNSDVNWLFQFDIAGGKLNVLQIPRDTFMPTYTNSSTGKFNSIYQLGDQNINSIQRVVNAIQDNFGIPVDAYVTTHCYDIVDMVDLVGGIPITLDQQITYEADKIIPAGYSVLNGTQAEWFVRYRSGFAEGDIGRVKNQRKFLAAAMEKMLHIYSDEGKTKFYGYLKEIYENEYILTDLSLENISMLADFASTLSLESVQVNMVPGEGAWYYPGGVYSETNAQSVWSVHKQATIDMLNEYYRPYQNDMTIEDSAIIELVTNYVTTNNDNTSDTLQELQDGAKPGQNKNEEQDY